MGKEDDYKKSFEKDSDGNFSIDTSERKCTDCLCVALFGIFWVGMVIVAAMAASQGDVNVFKRGFQVDGRICGIDSVQSSGHQGVGATYDKLFLPIVWQDVNKKTYSALTNYSVCTDECPEAGGEYTAMIYSKKTNSVQKVILYHAMGSKVSTVGTMKVCVPNTNGTNTVKASASLSEAIAALSDGAGVIAIGGVVALLSIVVYFVITKYCAGIIIWFIIACVLAGLCGTGAIFMSMASSSTVTADQASTYQVFGIICFVLAILWCALICFMRSRIQFAIAILKEVTGALADMPAMFGLPIFKFALIAIFYILWIAVAGGLASAGTFQDSSNASAVDIVVNAKSSVLSVVPQTMKYSESLQQAVYYHMFGMLWVNAFLIAMMNFMVASSFAQWYFAPQENGKKQLKSPVHKAFCLAWTKHMGTMVFGSLIVAIAEAIRRIVDYMIQQAEKQSPDSKVIKCLACILKCLTRCIETCLKYISTQAYIFTAIFGTSFLPSCYKLFGFLNKNALRIGTAQALGRIVVKLGRAFVVLFTLVVSFALMEYVEPWKTQLKSPYLVLFVICCLAFVMSAVAFEVFGMGMDTLIMCFVADEEMNDGVAAHSTNMKEHLDSINKANAVPGNKA